MALRPLGKPFPKGGAGPTALKPGAVPIVFKGGTTGPLPKEVGPPPSIPFPGGSPPVSTVTDPQLPVPRGAGVGAQREMQPIPRKGFMPRTPRRAAPRAGGDKAPRTISTAEMPIPISTTVDGAEPNAPTTSAPVERFRRENIRDRHARIFKRLPDVGGTAPWQGLRRGGGVPKLPAPTLGGVELPDPMDVARGKLHPRSLRQAIGAMRRQQKRAVVLRAGVGGLDVAQGPRYKPNRPNVVLGTLRDMRSRKWHGTMAGHFTAPASTVAAATAAKIAAPILTATTESIEPKDAENVARSAPAQLAAMTTFAAATEGAVPIPAEPPSASGVPWGALLVGAVALFALSRA